MTEEEAKTKWCPFARVAFDGGAPVAGNRHPRSAGSSAAHDVLMAPSLCIASACMAWRWRKDGAFRVQAEAEYRRTGRDTAPTEGFCGLAGKPS